MERRRLTIKATDNIGRTESITLILPLGVAQRLIKAENTTDDFGAPANYLREELNILEDDFRLGGSSLSKTQYRALLDFDKLIYNKFYNYKLSIC